MVFGIYNPYATIVPNGVITLIFWLLYLRFLYMYFTFTAHKSTSVIPTFKNNKVINLEDKDRIYDDCFIANFLWLYMGSKKPSSVIKSRARNHHSMVVRQLASVYIVEKGAFRFFPLILSILPFTLYVHDFLSIFGS